MHNIIDIFYVVQIIAFFLFAKFARICFGLRLNKREDILILSSYIMILDNSYEGEVRAAVRVVFPLVVRYDRPLLFLANLASALSSLLARTAACVKS